MTGEEQELLRVATIGPAHGLRGDVRLQVHTDDPDSRLATGTEIVTDPPEAGPLTVEHLYLHSGQYHARFTGHTDRDAAQTLRGVSLLAPPVHEPDAWYPHQLRGLLARTPAGVDLGSIEGVRHMPAHDVLLLRTTAGEQVLVPFVSQIVPEVDVDAGTVTIDPPGGLLPEEEQEA